MGRPKSPQSGFHYLPMYDGPERRSSLVQSPAFPLSQLIANPRSSSTRLGSFLIYYWNTNLDNVTQLYPLRTFVRSG